MKGNGEIDIKCDQVEINDISCTWITTKIHDGEEFSDSYNYEDEETHIFVFDKSGNLSLLVMIHIMIVTILTRLKYPLMIPF